MTRVISAALSEEQHDILRTMAFLNDTSMTQIVRGLVFEYGDREDVKKTISDYEDEKFKEKYEITLNAKHVNLLQQLAEIEGKDAEEIIRELIKEKVTCEKSLGLFNENEFFL